MRFNDVEHGSVFKKAGRIRNYIFFIVVGIFLCASSIFLTVYNHSTKDYIKTDAVIVDMYSFDEESNTKVAYTVDGIEYEEWTGFYSSGNDIGDVIEIRYNPQNPSEVAVVSHFFPILLGTLGLASFAYVAYRMIEDKNRETYVNEERSRTALYGNSNEFNEEFEVTSDSDLNEYYFHFCGKMNQSHILETPEREPVFEARLTKFSLLGECDYDFINYLTGKTFPHKIGKTISESSDDIEYDSHFSFDKENIWDYLHANGICIDSELTDLIHAKYHVLYNNREIGIIKTAGTAILENVKSNKFTENAHTDGLYKVYTSKTNVPIVFLVTFALSR